MQKRRLNLLLIISVTALAFYLRSINITEIFIFSGEFGDNFLKIKNFYLSKEIPLIGPPTSHPWLHFGPFYYWLMTPILRLFNWDPFVGAWSGVAFGTLAVLLNYIFIQKITNNRTAFYSSLLIAVSPLWINFSQSARFYFIVTILFYPFVYFLYIFLKEGKHLHLATFFYGLMFHFHYSPLIYAPIILLAILIKRKSISIKNLLLSLFTFLLTLTPLIIHDSKNQFLMTFQLIIWVPYRIAGFLGFLPKNNATNTQLATDSSGVLGFITQLFTTNQTLAPAAVITVIFSIIFALKIKKYRTFSYLLGSLLFISVVAFIIHGDSPVHYFLPVFPVPIILFAMHLASIRRKIVFGSLLGLIFLMFILNLNIKKPSNKINYLKNLEISQVIVNDANGQSFSLKRLGEGDEFEGQYAQNYQYIMWNLGNEPLINQPITYVIYEENFSKKTNETLIFEDNYIKVTKVNEK